MPKALKALLPQLADFLGTTPDRLFERQRELARQDVLPVVKGRGRAPGVPATAKAIAILLISCLVDDRRAKAVELAISAGAWRNTTAPDSLTGAICFLDAVTALIENHIVGEVTRLQVSSAGYAVINYKSGEEVRFGSHGHFRPQIEAIRDLNPVKFDEIALAFADFLAAASPVAASTKAA